MRAGGGRHRPAIARRPRALGFGHGSPRRGALTINGRSVATGDGIALSDERVIDLAATADSEVLLFDLV